MVKRSTRVAKRNEYLDVERKVEEALGLSARKNAAAAAPDRQAEQKTEDPGNSPESKKV
jgi:hypothetical protein